MDPMMLIFSGVSLLATLLVGLGPRRFDGLEFWFVVGVLTLADTAAASFWLAFLGFPPARRFTCWIRWHSYPNFDYTTNNGVNQHAKCQWCPFEGTIDSQGNLF